MKNMYVVYNTWYDNKMTPICLCGSAEKAAQKVEEYKRNFIQSGYGDMMPHFKVQKIPAELSDTDCIEFEE